MTDHLKFQNEKNTLLMVQNFSDWERNLRGWQIWDYAVNLEPPFSPVKLPAPQIVTPVQDNAHVQSGFGRFFRRNQATNPTRQISTALQEQAAIKPTAFYRSEPPSELSIMLPKDFEVSPIVCEQFFLSLSSFQSPVSFEILANENSVEIQFACDTGLVSYLTN